MNSASVERNEARFDFVMTMAKKVKLKSKVETRQPTLIGLFIYSIVVYTR